MDWDRLKIFHAVAEAGSFTLAAKRLYSSQSALSRQIKTLEESVNVSLFTRHARGLVLTDEGKQLYETAHAVYLEIEKTERALLESKEKPRGPLRVSATVAFGATWLTPRMKDFRRNFPEIDLELILSDDIADLSTREADVAIRFKLPEQADLMQRPLVKVHHHIYAHPKYINEYGTPESVDDLDHHNLIVYGPSVPDAIKNVNWLTSNKRHRKPYLSVSSLFGVLEALKAGMGLAAIPDYLAASCPELVRVLADVEGPAFQAYFVYPSELKGSKRVGVFRDFLLAKVAEEADAL
ncbi:MAG: LysR family transcriptional regulator [Sphingomonadales bacterium]|nr:LysR family transcriptional regulator [Sphingomonadales bacterium]